ncbi:unnamed protein product [Diatraea saccharalis]|uniref:Virescein n=1 Tax=Diatraea saccharalis TaxID=40085 RepID=A0A9N9WB80_9NEOP|nr:unnamed protein product [Diatraea saccharalis]
MKISIIFVLAMAFFGMLLGGAQAAPAPDPKLPSGKTIKKVGKAIKTGFGILSAAGTAHEVYTNLKNRNNN